MTAAVGELRPPESDRAPAIRGGWYPGIVLRRVGRYALNVYAVLGLVYLFIPIFVIILFSFNDISGRFNFTWQGFTLDHWKDPFAIPQLVDAMQLSLRVAALATVVATGFGALVAMALVRYRFRGGAAVNLLLVLPLTTPEVVFGSSLLTLFLNFGWQRGYTTIVISHIAFAVSFVALTVKARIRGLDWTLEDAAMDLGATPWRTFYKVTFPRIFPGILAAALLTFALSLDDFIITLFNAGGEETFPIYVWGAARVAVPPQINVIATMILVASVALLGIGTLWQRRRDAR